MKRKMLVVFSLVVALSVTACGNKVDDSEVETPLENEMDVSEGTPSPEAEDEVKDEVEEDQEDNGDQEESKLEESILWPADFLENVPEFKDGEVHKTRADDENHVFIGFKSVENDDAVAYIEKVKEAGFTKDASEYISDYTVNYKGNDKNGNFVKIHWAQDNYLAIDMIKPEK